MAERVIDQRRKSQLFLDGFVPVTVTYDEFVRKKLKPGKFLMTKTGIIKIIGMLTLISGLALFEGKIECENTSIWYPYLLPITLGLTIFIQLSLFMIFASGFTIKKPGFWIYLDMSIILVLSIFSLLVSIISDKDCMGQDTLTKICGPLCMAGSVILIISSPAVFLMYRFNDELLDKEENEDNDQSEQRENPRKSIFA